MWSQQGFKFWSVSISEIQTESTILPVQYVKYSEMLTFVKALRKAFT
jgi:hypothetical protein